METSEGGAPTDSVGDKNQDSKEPATKPENEMVSKHDLTRALDDLHKYKRQAKELQASLESAQSNRLKEKEDYKSLFEQYEAKWKQELDGHAKTKAEVEYNQKYNAAFASLKKEGLIDEAEKLIDKDSLADLIVEHTDQGRYIIHGKDALVQRWKKELPFAFKSQTAPKINGGGSRKEDLSTGEVTIDRVFQAEKEYKAGKMSQTDYVKVVQLFRNRKKA